VEERYLVSTEAACYAFMFLCFIKKQESSGNALDQVEKKTSTSQPVNPFFFLTPEKFNI
jgi:hypothetical protein